MALTPSNMLPIGTEAPDFQLPDVLSGKKIKLSDYAEYNILVIAFICNHCPYVIHINDELIRLAHDYHAKQVGFIAISSNDIENYPQDGPEQMREQAIKLKYPFVYLYDETQAVAKQYDAACTPDLYVFDRTRKLRYRGRLDESRPGNDKPLTGSDLRAALDALLKKENPPDVQYPSMGCNIKWKK